jgi:hypothetical protein
MKKLCLIAMLGVLVSTSHAYSYFEDFQGTVGPEWSHTNVTAAPADANRKFLGVFANNTVTLTLNGLNVGDTATISFDLYLANSWDGSDGAYGPDRFRLNVDGTDLLHATFANVIGKQQSYSAGNPLGGPLVAARTDADEQDTLGYNFYGNTVYKFGGPINGAFTTAVTSPTMVLTFQAYGLQGWADEGWGIDNVCVEAVPEPATMVALAAGALALIRRRR